MKIPRFRLVNRNVTDRHGVERVRGYGLEVVFVERGYNYLVEEAQVEVAPSLDNGGSE